MWGEHVWEGGGLGGAVGREEGPEELLEKLRVLQRHDAVQREPG